LKTTENPTLQVFQIAGVRYINPEDALEALKNSEAVMIDVREINELGNGIIPLDRVLNHPMSVILDRLPYISKDQNIIVACPGGVRSSKVAGLMMQYGYDRVASLDGGISTWIANGLPYKIKVSAEDCNCRSNKKIRSVLIVKASGNRTLPIDYKNVKMIRL